MPVTAVGEPGWRVASLNVLHGGGTRLSALIDRLLGYDADVIVVTEFRENGVGDQLIAALRRQSYDVSYPSGSARNSVLIASRTEVTRAWSLSEHLDRRRLWCVDLDGLVVCGVGMPNKHEKLPYWNQLVSHGRAHGVDLFIGDFNTGDNSLDKDPAGARFVAAEMPARLVKTGYVDLWRSAHPGVRDYSWFSNTGNGFRIDHAFASETVAAAMTACEFDHEPRLLGETDHSALVVTFSRDRLSLGPRAPRIVEVVAPVPTREPAVPRASRLPAPRAVSGDWTRTTFTAAVTDPVDRAFLLRLLDLLDENSRQPRLGTHDALYFGKRPGGGMFVYPFGLRHPPFHLAINTADQLTIRGCWRKFPKVTGHPGFAELASMLSQDEAGPAQNVPVAGLDPDKVWEVGVRVARAING